MNFRITTDAWTAQVAYRVSEPVTVAESGDYQTAREIARSESRRTSGRYFLVAPQGSLIRTEAFSNGFSEG